MKNYVFFLVSFFVISAIGAVAQQMAPTDPVYWCNVSRSQVSAERDAGLSQIEAYKVRVQQLEAQVAALTKAIPKE